MNHDERPVTRRLLAPMVEQPEPTMHGDHYVLALEDLVANGWTHIMFHFPDASAWPDNAVLVKEGRP